jgi:hypothetical protein
MGQPLQVQHESHDDSEDDQEHGGRHEVLHEVAAAQLSVDEVA